MSYLGSSCKMCLNNGVFSQKKWPARVAYVKLVDVQITVNLSWAAYKSLDALTYTLFTNKAFAIAGQIALELNTVGPKACKWQEWDYHLVTTYKK